MKSENNMSKALLTDKEKFQADLFKQVNEHLKMIELKVRIFHENNKSSWTGELGNVLKELEDINDFMKPSKGCF